MTREHERELSRTIAHALLECESPRQFASVLSSGLLTAAQHCHDAASELESAWQDRNAGKPWDKLAAKLERYAASVAKGIE